jgi:hypothetical protein
VNDEKGWWEAEAEASPPDEPPLLSARIVVEEEPEASLIFPPDSFKPDDEVEVGAGSLVGWMLAGLLLLFMLYLENRMSTSDSIFLEICFGILFW